MKKYLVIIISIICVGSLLAQNTKTITFTARYTDNSYVQLDRIRIENHTKKWVQTIFWNDTVFKINNVGIRESDMLNFAISSNMPNPFEGHTSVNLQLSQDEEVSMVLYDLSGKQYLHKKANMQAGNYHIDIHVGVPQMYILQVRTASGTQSIKMIAQTGAGTFSMQIQDVEKHISLVRKADSQYGFEVGDTMVYSASIHNGDQNMAFHEIITANDTLITFTFSKIPGYTLLDIYCDSSCVPEGIVWHLSDTIGYDNGKPYGKHGKIMSFNVGHGMYSSYADGKFAYAFDSLDGEANTDSLMKLRYDTTLSFPERLQAAVWCREKGPEWYMPAILEILEFRLLRDSLNAKFSVYPDWRRIGCGAFLGDFISNYWSSTEVDNAATEPRKRKAYFCNFSPYIDIGKYNEDTGEYFDYYSGINIGHTYEDLTVRAVKKF